MTERPPIQQQPAYEVLRALDEAGLTKGQFRVLAHIWRRRDCMESVRNMAGVCRMHPDYVRVVIRHLVNCKMITRAMNPGKRNRLALTATAEWLVVAADQKAVDAKAAASAHQLALDVQGEFFDRLHVQLNRVEAEVFARYMAQDADKFERVTGYVVERIADGKAGRQPRVISAQKIWVDYWKRCK